jgi:hypothetical protein
MPRDATLAGRGVARVIVTAVQQQELSKAQLLLRLHSAGCELHRPCAWSINGVLQLGA